MIDGAAYALLLGWPPVPGGYLDLEAGPERILADLVIERASEIQASQEKNRWENMARAVQNGVARAFKRGR